MPERQSTPCAEIAFREEMGYTLAHLAPGESAHNNVKNVIRDVPAPLLGKWFTQVVSARVSPIEIVFMTSGKLYVLAGMEWTGTGELVEYLKKRAHKEPLPRLVADDGTFEVYSISAAAGERILLPTQAMLVTDSFRDCRLLDPDRYPKRVLVIAARPHCGAFSMFFQTLGLLRYAELAGLVPVVYFNRHVCFWNHPGHQGTRNAWEYFFLPVAATNIEHLCADPSELEGLDARELQEALGDGVQVRNEYLAEDIGIAGWMDERQRTLCADLVTRYVRVRTDLMARIDEFYQRHLAGQPFIGVHYRGTDKIIEAAPVAFERYERELDRWIDRLPDTRIFAATDCARFLDQLASKYPKRVICTNAHRSHDGHPIHFGNPHSATEVIIDAVLLSRSLHLLHGVSNVSAGALAFCRDLSHTDLT